MQFRHFNNKYFVRRDKIKLYKNFKHKGFTLVELLIIIVVIVILAGAFIYSSTEAVTTAKATKILANLQILKRAVEQWYSDNREKIEIDGRVKMYSDKDPKPVQEWEDKDLKLSLYISNTERSGINLHSSHYDSNIGKQKTEISKGCYGVCDGGTTVGYHRNAWYVGYSFNDNEAKVKEKIKGRMEAAGVFFGTADAHKDDYNDNSAAVWLRVF